MPLNVLVNGGGIAGPCLAFWLTRQGHAVTITEQARQLRTGGQAVDFRGPSLVVLEKMGLLCPVRASATRMGPLVLVDERGKEIGRLPAEVISGELEIFWGDLARILYEAVRDDVDYRFGVRVTAVNDDGERVEATFSDASTATYDLVIGADGLHSGVRGLVLVRKRSTSHSWVSILDSSTWRTTCGSTIAAWPFSSPVERRCCRPRTPTSPHVRASI